jgi:hypothetical protein
MSCKFNTEQKSANFLPMLLSVLMVAAAAVAAVAAAVAVLLAIEATAG